MYYLDMYPDSMSLETPTVLCMLIYALKFITQLALLGEVPYMDNRMLLIYVILGH